MLPTTMEKLRPREGKVSTQVQTQALNFLWRSMFKTWGHILAKGPVPPYTLAASIPVLERW